MANQSTRVRKAKKEKAKAEAFIDGTVKEAVKKVVKRNWSEITTKEDIERVRDQEGRSWADVAKALDLGSPSGARSAYTALTGRHHSTSMMTGKRAPRGSKQINSAVMKPSWTEETPDEEIRDALEGHMVTVERMFDSEEIIHVYKVMDIFDTSPKGKPVPLSIDLIEVGTKATRCIAVDKIKEIR